MAAAELKRNQVLQEEIIIKQDASSLDCQKKIEDCRFRILDMILYIFSMGIMLTNIVTDIVVTAEYFLRGCLAWFYLEIGILFIPTSLIQFLSLNWYHEDGNLKKIHWISHAFLFGILYRYIVLLKEVLKSFNSKYSAKSKAWVLKNENNVYTLHLFISFVVSVPQLIFQLYLMAIQQSVPFWTGASAATTLCSLTWAISGYIKFKLGTHWNHQKSKWSALIVQLCWRGGLLASRITALVLAAFFLKIWLFVFLGIHSLIMTTWITFQNIPSRKLWEKYTFNYILGLIYFFDIFLVNSDYLWYRICTYYVLMMIENVTLLIVYTFYIQETLSTNVFVLSYILILGGSFFGLVSMLLYYRKFNYDKIFKESLQLSKHLDIFKDTKNTQSDTIRSKRNESLVSLPLSSDISPTIGLSEEVTADKKSLLTNIEQNTESVERGILNSSFAQSDDPEEVPKVIVESKLDSPNSLKKYEAKIEEVFETKKAESKTQQDSTVITISRENSDKRRGICSLTQLVTDVDNYVEKTFSLSSYEDKHKLKGFKVVPLSTEDSSDIYVIPENIKSRQRMNTPVISEVNEATGSEKTMESNSQKDETMSQITSIHDYENLCPLGVARPPWCIRSWRGYTDIETYIHDDSIVRDRRRDTLTSTATATTLSSDFSDGTYSSSPFKRIMKNSRQDDYLDTLVYDLVDWESNVFNEEDSACKFQVNEDSNLFAAKPIVIDDRGGMLALDTILEEHEELTSSSESSLDPKRKTTVSSLVATIDEIRKYAAENSPRHVYHRTEKQYEDLSHCILMKNSPLHPRSSNNCTENPWNLLFIRDNSLDISSICSRVSMGKTPLISAILSDSPVLEPRTKPEKYTKEDISLLDENNVYVEMKALKAENFSNLYKELNDSLCEVLEEKVDQNGEENFQHQILGGESTILEASVDLRNFSNQTISCDNPLKSKELKPDPMSIGNLSPKLNSPRVGSSLSNEKRRRSICRPRRKFSLLREKFEVKSKQVSSQTVLTGNKRILRDFNNLDIYDSVVAYEKENLPACKHFEEKGDHIEDVRCNLKERRSIFLKQVLSPPKFQNWSRKKVFSPSAEIIPKAL